MLPGFSVVIDDKDFIFSSDDPKIVDYVFNLLVEWIGMRHVIPAEGQINYWPDPKTYVGQMPIVTIGTTAPGEVPLYPNPTFFADPIFTPSQVAFFQGTRILSMGVIDYDKQQCRFLMSNEVWYLFDKCGGIIDKYMPSDIVKLMHDGEEWPINALEFNNIDLEIEFTDG